MCAIDLFSKYAWFVPLNDKKWITTVNAFQKIISKGHKQDKIWVDQGSELKNYLFKRILKNNNIEIYSAYNEGKSVISERFIRNLKNKIYKHLTALSGDVCFDVLCNIAKKYSNGW